MHLELVSLLRCPVPHADGWLVAAVDRADGRMIIDGTLGCPTCGAEFAIRDGVTWLLPPLKDDFGVFEDDDNRALDHGRTTDVGENWTIDARSRAKPTASVLVEDAVRLAALLAATDPSQTIALFGHDVEEAEALQTITGVRCLVLNPPALRAPQSHAAPCGVIEMSLVIPLASAQLHAVSVADSEVPLVSAAAGLLRSGGRLLAPASAPIPSTLRELARDETQWVAERVAVASAPIPLSRRPIN